MPAATKYVQLGDDILAAVGGEKNVASVAHCATRLRFVLKDREKADKATVEGTKGVITVVEAGGQFQVVIGNSVGQVHESLVANYNLPVGEGAKGNLLNRAIELVTSIFTPFLWVLAGTGLLKALLAVAVEIWPDFASTGAYAIFYAAGDAVFQFLPILIAITAAKRFKANQWTAIAIAGALIYSATIAVIPNAEGVTVTLQGFADAGGELTFFGIPVVMVAYLSAVIPTILAVFAQGHLERLLTRVIPETLRNFAVPLVTIAVIVPVTFLAIGPVADLLGSWISDGINWVWGIAPAIGGLLMGALWQVFVIFGVHWGFVPVIVQDLSEQGYSLLTGPLFAAVLAQAAATAAVFFKTRNKELKEIAGPASVSGFLAGITEPAIYGVTLRLKRPFVYGVIGGAVGGAIAAAGGSAAEGFVLPGAITLAATLNVGSFAMQLIGTGTAIVIAFGLTMVLGFKDLPAGKPAAGSAAVEAEGVVETEAYSLPTPVAGEVVSLAAVPDKAFASGLLGPGIAVLPSENTVHTPIDGTVMVAMPHAYGIKSDTGLEILVHIGLDTVKLNGKHFTPKVEQGQRVSAGDVLTEVDFTALVTDGYSPITVVVVTNADRYSTVVPVAEGSLRAKDLVLEVAS